MLIDCDECSMQGTTTCDGCVVTFLCTGRPGEPLYLDDPEVHALGLLSEAGLAPRLRHAPRTR